jgi:hypothetical protein
MLRCGIQVADRITGQSQFPGEHATTQGEIEQIGFALSQIRTGDYGPVWRRPDNIIPVIHSLSSDARYTSRHGLGNVLHCGLRDIVIAASGSTRIDVRSVGGWRPGAEIHALN